MKTFRCVPLRWWMFKPFFLHLAPIVSASALLVSQTILHAAGIVTNCTEANLRAAMNGGGNVTFTCDGTITLSNTLVIGSNTFMNAGGHHVTISGGGLVPILSIKSNVLCTILDLTFADGLNTNGGGGIRNAGGELVVSNCTFRDNTAMSGPGAFGVFTPANGGAILNLGRGTFSRCAFIQNHSVGQNGDAGSDGYINSPTDGKPGGDADGAAIYNTGVLTVENSLFASNSATGGNGGNGGNGNPFSPGGALPQTGGYGGTGGQARGGAVFNAGTASVVNVSMAWNVATAGNGGSGGNAGLVVFPHSAFGYRGGNGGSGGSAYGAISDTNGMIRLTNCTLAFNSATPGAGAAAGAGTMGQQNGNPGDNGVAAGGLGASGTSLLNTLLATNLPGGNCSGALTDLGHNLSSDATCTFTNTGSLNNTDAKLATLADYGGSTLTLALLAGSPAIDAGDDAATLTDQRGLRRPAGLHVDIGAYESGILPPTLSSVTRLNDGNLRFRFNDSPEASFTALATTNIALPTSNWTAIGVATQISPGVYQFTDTQATNFPQRYYQVLSP